MQEVAEILDVSLDRAYALARDGIIPVVHMGRQVRVNRETLSDWIKAGGYKVVLEGEPAQDCKKLS